MTTHIYGVADLIRSCQRMEKEYNLQAIDFETLDLDGVRSYYDWLISEY